MPHSKIRILKRESVSQSKTAKGASRIVGLDAQPRPPLLISIGCASSMSASSNVRPLLSHVTCLIPKKNTNTINPARLKLYSRYHQNQPVSTMFSCCFTTRKGESESQSSKHGVPHNVQEVPIREQAKSYVPSWRRDESAGSTTGVRKPSDAGRNRPSTTSDRRRKDEVQPTDYLYFGDGTSCNQASSNVSCKPQPQSAGSDGGASSQPGSGFATGLDNSGYTATGLNNNSQMGYSSLTYGGSLQYDYAGTQPFGAGS